MHDSYELKTQNFKPLSPYYRHHEAVKHVKLGLELLEMAKSSFNTDNTTSEGLKQSSKVDKNKREKFRTIVTTMIIAYYNFGTELEYLKEYKYSL